MLLAALLMATAGSKVQGDSINVFAAASLKEAFISIARSYEKEHPSTKINLNFGGSQLLAQQINNGAAADVFASADQRNLDKIKVCANSQRIFVQNRLAIAVRTGLSGLLSPVDLSKATTLVVADPSVPVGNYTEAFFGKASKRFGSAWLAQVRSKIVSKELDVKAVLAKVSLGEADAGVVYVSDAVTAGNSVVRIDIPDEFNVTADYPVAIPEEAMSETGAKDFIRYLFAPASQQELVKDGFISPLHAPSQLVIIENGKSRSLRLPLSRSYPRTSVKASAHGNSQTYQGVPLANIFGKTSASQAIFIAADGYTVSLPVADLKKNRAILVLGDDGNYQLIDPGTQPNMWVHWIRRIELK